MITRGNELEKKNGRKDYPLISDEVAGRHFAVWTTTPANPFGPHKHEQREIWFILEGQATVSVDGEESEISEIHWGNLGIEAAGNEHLFRAQVYLGEIEPDAVSVELYAEPRPGEAPRRRPMRRDHALSGAAGGYLYVAAVPADRPAADYTPRIVASHPEAQVPAETPLIRWYPN